MKKKKENLTTTHPELIKEWHPTKNGELTPQHLTFGSNKKVWWICEHGHEWEVNPNGRTSRPTGCPYCSGRRLLIGFNDLATTHPQLAKEWHLTKNGELTPQQLTFGSSKAIWWQCDCGHEWKATLNQRTSLNKKCPKCQRQRKKNIAYSTLPLTETHPELMKEWDFENNSHLDPASLTANSIQKVSWKGECGHRWETTIYYRTHHPSKCPYCSNRKLLIGFNDLATKHPELIKEWHPVKNETLTPQTILATTNKMAWWKGDCGHEWETPVSHRTRKKSQCPYCINRRILKGYNDLATTHPHLISEWNEKLNHPLTVFNVSKGNTHKVWWTCPHGHEWKAQIYSRTKAHHCPRCVQEKKQLNSKQKKDFA